MNSEDLKARMKRASQQFANSLQGEFFVCDTDWRLTYVYEIINVCGQTIVCCNDGYANYNWPIDKFLKTHTRVIKNEPLERTQEFDPLYDKGKNLVEVDDA